MARRRRLSQPYLQNGHVDASSSCEDCSTLSLPRRLKKVCGSDDNKADENNSVIPPSSSTFQKQSPPNPLSLSPSERKRRISELNKRVEKLKQRRLVSLQEPSENSDTSNASEDGSEYDRPTQRYQISRPVRKFNVKKSKFIAFANDVCNTECEGGLYYAEDEFDDFICDEEDTPKFNGKIRRKKIKKMQTNTKNLNLSSEEEEFDDSEEDFKADCGEIALRREYDEWKERTCTAMESLSFTKAYKRYVMYVALCLLSPSLRFPFPDYFSRKFYTDGASRKSEEVEEGVRELNFAYFQPAITKIEKFIMSKRDQLCMECFALPQYDTKPFEHEFKAKLSSFPTLRWEIHPDGARLGMCEACRGYRNVHCYLILDGVEYDSKSLWNGDFESWFHATRLPWLGKLAFPLSPDPSLAIRTRKAKTHALQHESSDDESEGFSSEETVLDKNSLLLLKSQDTKSSLYLPLGSHCFQQAKKWHEIQHYKYFLLKSIHKYLKKFNDKILEDPIEAAECLKKKYGQLLYNRFECTVIEAKPNAIKKGTRKDPVATDPWNL